jgi:HPt (histidine-containing phosphotransfer) domain-containing protein
MKHFDYDDLCDRLLNNQKSIQEVLRMSRDFLEEYPQILMKSIETRDLVKLKRTIHRIKGVAATASFYRLADLAAQFEACKEWSDEDVHRYQKKIEMEIQELFISIDTVLQ